MLRTLISTTFSLIFFVHHDVECHANTVFISGSSPSLVVSFSLATHIHSSVLHLCRLSYFSFLNDRDPSHDLI